jgi:hypothetical protein
LPNSGGLSRQARRSATCHDLTNLPGIRNVPIQSSEIEKKSSIDEVVTIRFALFRIYTFVILLEMNSNVPITLEVSKIA